MKPEEFVAAVHDIAFARVVNEVVAGLEDGPSGTALQPRARALHEWYSALDDHDRRMVKDVVRDSAHFAVFQLLCVLDGVIVIDDPPHVELRLTVTDATGTESVLASMRSPLELHDEFNGLVHPPSEPWPNWGENASPS